MYANDIFNKNKLYFKVIDCFINIIKLNIYANS